jgi:hypothetical protein
MSALARVLRVREMPINAAERRKGLERALMAIGGKEEVESGGAGFVTEGRHESAFRWNDSNPMLQRFCRVVTSREFGSLLGVSLRRCADLFL